MRVERNSRVGLASTPEKSVPRRWASRSGWLVLTEASATEAVTDTSSRVSPTWRLALKSSNRPRTLLRPRWRTLKWMPEWAASTGQSPATRGRAVVVLVSDIWATSWGCSPLGDCHGEYSYACNNYNPNLSR